MENLIWFVAGFVLARLLVWLQMFLRTYIMLKQSEIDCLRLLQTTAESTQFMQQIRGTIITNEDTPTGLRNILKIQVNLDEHVLKNWKKNSIHAFISMYPVKYRRNMGYNDWEGAMQHLETLSSIASKDDDSP